MPTHPFAPVACQQRLPRTTAGEQQRDLLRLLDCLELTASEVRLAQMLAQSSPYPVRAIDLAAAVSGCPCLDRRRRAVLEQQIAHLRCKLIAHDIRILCVERYGYLLLPDGEK
ncbi:MAG: winged helix-turn-helix domain-containing protein [Ktedonobacteraceae bacterium]